MNSFFFGSMRSTAHPSPRCPADDAPHTAADTCQPARRHHQHHRHTTEKPRPAEKPARPVAELVFIIDASGSMMPLTSDTVGGYNSVLKKTAGAGDNALVTTVFFNQASTIVHDREPIGSIEPLAASDYVPCGTTALLDTVGSTIERIDLIQQHQPAGQKPSSTTVCIITDGLENASHKFTYRQVKHLISQHRERGWEFLFLGANIDVAEQAESLGIDLNRAVAYDADSTGTFAAFQSFGDAAVCACAGAPLDDSWRAAVDQDQEGRGKRRRR